MMRLSVSLFLIFLVLFSLMLLVVIKTPTAYGTIVSCTKVFFTYYIDQDINICGQQDKITDCEYGGDCVYQRDVYTPEGEWCGTETQPVCNSGPVCNPPPGSGCTSSATNSCGMPGYGTIQFDCSCSASPPPDSACSTPTPTPTLCSPPAGSACTSAPNSCGDTNTGTIQSNCSCSVSSAPAERPDYGAACATANSCGQTNPGTYICSGSGVACSASPPPESGCSQLPIAVHESATCTVTSGYTFDPDYCGSIPVYIYDGQAGAGGVYMGSVTANLSRPDVGAVYPGHTNSGWSWTIPTSLKNGFGHWLYAYTTDVNSSGSPTGVYPLSSGSPRLITCNDPPTGTFSAATCGTASGTATDPQGTPVSIEVRDGGPTGTLLASGTTSGTGTAWSFTFSPTAGTLGNGQTHTLYAYARDVPNPPGTWFQLTGTRQITCAPSVTLNANPLTVDTANKTTLSWTVSSGVSFSSSPSGWFNSATIVNGSGAGSGLSAKLTADTTFSLTGTNAAGVSTTKTITVGVGAPLVTEVSITQTDACVSGPGVTVSWTSTATEQESYELRITYSSVPGGGTPAGCPDCSTGWIDSSSISRFVDLGPLYGQTLYAHVRVKQVGNGQASSFGVSSAFTTPPAGAWPGVNFSTDPAKLRIGSPTQFIDETSGNPTAWGWSFGDSGVSDQQNPLHTYTAAGPYTISLTATNAYGTCTKTVTGVNTQRAIPFFREIRP